VVRAMAQAVSRRPLTAAALVRAQVNPVRFVVDKVALGQVFLRVLRFPLSISFQTGLHISENSIKEIVVSRIHSLIHSFIHPFFLIRG
jgi:hypothetical protein